MIGFSTDGTLIVLTHDTGFLFDCDSRGRHEAPAASARVMREVLTRAVIHAPAFIGGGKARGSFPAGARLAEGRSGRNQASLR